MSDVRDGQAPPIEAALKEAWSRIGAACRRVDRSPDEVTLVGITKTVPLDLIRRARSAGLDQFGENYAAELAAKAPTVEATWHFVGRLQTGTARLVADHASVIHSATPGSALERVSGRAQRRGKTIACLVQIDFTGGRQGIDPGEAEEFIQLGQTMPGIRMVGLMTMPPWTGDAEATRPYFRRLREVRDRLRTRLPDVCELSMGMSGDYEVAVEEGATMLRVGTALFGERPRVAAAE